MFRSGRTGVALVILRLSLLSTLLLHLYRYGPILSWVWTTPAIVLISAALALGGATGIVCALSCAAEIGFKLTARGFDGSVLMLSIPLAIALAMLGPGAYSLDARLFGRRVIVPFARR